MRRDDISRKLAADLPDGALWRRSRIVDTTTDDGERALDLAGFAEGRLDPDDRERVAEWLAGDPIAAGDVAAVRALAAADAEPPESVPEAVIVRASSLVGGSDPQPAGNVIRFAPRHPDRPRFHGIVHWSSLVAAMAVASWLGFTLGMDTSLSLAQTGQAGDNGSLSELFDPSSGLMGDLTGGTHT
jgi:anti-sigma factor RsiW